MNSVSLKKTASLSAFLTSLHFAVTWLVGYYLFSRDGLSRTPARSVYEAVLGVGVTYLGFPDTVPGWVLNSVMYGIAGAVMFHVCKCLTGDRR
ncbi:MAG TPA: hypothetical protein VG796_28195 [Verrucomicrobiales bacterium]|nr:hypothetical protein [Verrucomicrobiales bacterium]